MEKGQSNSAQIISPIVMLDLCTLRFFLSLSGEIPFCDVDLMKKTCSGMAIYLPKIKYVKIIICGNQSG